jgi:hypothetical protein
MTAARRRRKPHTLVSGRRPGIGLVLAALAAVALGLAGPIRAATTERIVIDRNTGLAISGFDPVAYFTDAQALPGKGEFEQVVAGTAWRFRNAGNRAAFLADPDIYTPRFGGYDPVGVARGVAVAGSPLLWVIKDQRLYLFYASQTRDEFASDSERLIATSDGEWPAISRLLVP